MAQHLLHLVELRRSADERRRDLDDDVAAVVGAAVQAVVEQRAGQEAAVSPLQVDITAAKLRIDVLSGELNAFKIEVARTYVTGDAIQRLERRIDNMLESVRDDIKEMRELVVKATTGRPPG